MSEATVTLSLAEFDAMRARLQVLETGATVTDEKFDALRRDIIQLWMRGGMTVDECLNQLTRIMRTHLIKEPS